MGVCFSYNQPPLSPEGALHTTPNNPNGSAVTENIDINNVRLHANAVEDSNNSSQTQNNEIENIALNFQHILEGLYDAACKAQTTVQMNNVRGLLEMFPVAEDGVHVPKTIQLRMADGKVTDVPLYTLINHKNLNIHELKIKTKLDVDMKKAPSLLERVRGLGHSKKYYMNIVPGKKDTMLEICMRLDDPPEMHNRILNHFETTIL